MKRDVVVCLRNGRVLVEPDGLPELRTEDDHASYADLAARVGGGLLAGPSRRLADGLRLHLVVPDPTRPAPSPDQAWRDPGALADAVTEPLVRDAAVQAVGEYDETLPVPEDRPAWFRRGWPEPVLDWARERLAAAGRPQTGPVELVRMWSLSAVLRVPSSAGPAYLKATNRHFHAEAAITRVLSGFAPEVSPTLLAEDDDRAWMLLDELHGLGEQRASGAATRAAERLAAVQLRSVDHLDDLAAAGCPLRTEPETLAGLAQVLAGSIEAPLVRPAQLEAARAVEPRLRELVAELWSLGLPATLCHGDLHLGNVADDGNDLRMFDWTDASVTHPFLDAVHLARSVGWERDDPVPDPQVLAAYARPWREACPGADVDRALQLAAVVDHVFQAISYEGIQRSVEPVSRWELADQVAAFLRAAPGLVAEHDARSPRR